MRGAFIWVHRYVGLLMSVFLIIAGLTGSLLVFYHELDAALNPQLFHAEPPAPNAVRLDPFQLRQRLEQQVPEVRVHYVPLEEKSGEAVAFYVVAASGQGEAAQLENDEYFVHPYSGEILGKRKWGDLSQGTKNLMPFVYRLHYSLALGTVGSYLMGIIALLWTIDCFVGAYLTFPVSSQATQTGWFSRWAPSWLVRGGSLFKWMFTWHRASGLWIWVMLFVFAWSAVGLNLREVYHPVMKATVGMKERVYKTLPELDSARVEPKLDWYHAYRIGQELMQTQASQQGVKLLEERRLGYYPSKGVFRYQVRSSLDVSQLYPNTAVWFDGNSGAFVAFEPPTGQKLGNTLTTWLYTLHFAAVWGLPFRLFVCLCGILIAVLSLSGVYIWWKKRRARAFQSRKMSQNQATSARSR